MDDTKKTAPAQNPTAKAAFDRTVCFTCFGDYVDTLKMIAAQQGAEIAYAAFEILADYCLYGIEPDPDSNPWGLVWPIVERRARLSINNRRRGFGTPDKELAERIREYAAENPEATQRQIADAVDCHRNTVSKTLRDDAALHDSLPCHGSVHDSSLYHIHDSNSSRVQTPRSVRTPTAFLQSPPAVNVQDSAKEAAV